MLRARGRAHDSLLVSPRASLTAVDDGALVIVSGLPIESHDADATSRATVRIRIRP